MTIEFVVSTINRLDVSFLNKIFCNIEIADVKILVINQCFNIDVPTINDIPSNIRIISVKDKGTSNSRNLALKNINGDIIVFVDDDVCYETDAVMNIMKCHQKSCSDILTFKSKFENGLYLKKYSSISKFHSKKTIRNIADIDITFKRKAIIDANVSFDTRFGLGAQYPLGEYYTFLLTCLKKGLVIEYQPFDLLVHPNCLSSGLKFDRKFEIGRGALFAKINIFLSPLFAFYFSISKINLYKHKHSLIKELYYLNLGIFRYIFK